MMVVQTGMVVVCSVLVWRLLLLILTGPQTFISTPGERTGTGSSEDSLMSAVTVRGPTYMRIRY